MTEILMSVYSKQSFYYYQPQVDTLSMTFPQAIAIRGTEHINLTIIALHYFATGNEGKCHYQDLHFCR